MSVYLRRGKWVIDYYPHGRRGRRIRLTLPEGIKTKAEAGAIERDLKQARDKDAKPYVSLNATVNELFRKYLDWYDLHRKPSSYRDIESVFRNHISRILGKYPALDINNHHINVYKRMRCSEDRKYKYKKIKISYRSINKEIIYFSGFLRWCWKNIKGFPKRDFEIERLPYDRPLPIVLTLREAVIFIKSAEPFYRPLLLLMFNLGLRLSAATTMRWADVDMDNRSVRVTTKGGPIILPMTGWVYNELKALKKTGPATQYVFPSPTNPSAPVKDIRKAIERARKASGITKHVHAHLLRHSLATHLLDKDINLRTIQEILGHADISTTQFYTQVALQNKRKALRNAGIG